MALKEFMATREKIEGTEDSKIDQALLDSAKQCAEEMKNEVAGLQGRLQRTSQEAKDKLQQENPAGSSSGTSHK